MVIFKKINKNFLVALFFLVLSLFLIFVWFKNGHFYGGGDVGLPTYNPMRIFQIAKFIWWEAIAPGFLIPHTITSITLYLFLSFFQLLGIEPLGIQAILFFTLVFLMGFGMYLLTLSIYGGDKKVYAIMAGLFYIFNPYMMTQIWHRFVHTSFLFASFIPFLILFWRLWIKSGNYLFLLYFLLVNLLASYMFGTIAFVVPFWLIMFLFTFCEIFLPWGNKLHLIKVLWRSIFGFILWVLYNGWWLIPVTTVSQGIASQQHSIRESISTLFFISKQAILPYSLQMVNSYYLFDQADLGGVYKSFFFRLIPWLGVIIIFCGMVYALLKKHLASFALIFLVIIMLSKGISPPFGQAFSFLFSKFFVFGLLRNPFEKIGILLPVVSSILFVIGIEGLKIFFSKRLSETSWKIALIILFAIMGIYYWPMYQGKIFGRIDHQNYIEVPQSYLDANLWLDKEVRQDSIIDGKILHLPLTRSDIVTYKWRYGYHGIEPSASIFTSLPSISHGVGLKNTDDALTALSLIFHNPYNLHQDKILKLLQDFNVRFIVLHKDLDWLGGDTYNPSETEKVLNSLSFVEKEVEFGDLVIYRVKDEFFAPKIEINNNISLVYPQAVNMRMWPWLVSQNEGSSISPINKDLDNNLKSSTNETLIFPENTFFYPEASISSSEAIEKQLIAPINIMLGNVQYLKQLGIIHVGTERIVQKIVSASQKLIEIYSTSEGIDEYSDLLDSVFPDLDDNSTLYFDIAKITIVDLLKLHEVTLSVIGKRIEDRKKIKISELDNKIKQFLAKEKLLPLFPYQGKVSETRQRQSYDFQVNTDGKYELLMTNSKMKDAYTDKLSKVDFQINNEIVTLSGKEIDNIISFGKIDLKQGLNEISFGNPSSVNLISSLDNLVRIGNVKIQDGAVEMSVSKNNPSAVESPILHTVGEDIFQISFDAIIPANIGLYIQVIQDMDIEQNGQKTPRINFLQHLNQSDWQGNYTIKLPALSLSTRKAVIRIIALIPPEVPNLENALVIINNLRLIRILNNQMFLRSAELNNQKAISGTVDFKEKDAVEYEGDLKLIRPGFIFFKEAYHPGWKLFLTKDTKQVEQTKHYLANLYGNAWLVDEAGEYKFKIEFEPQGKVTVGLYLAIFGVVVLVSLIIFQKNKKI